VVNVSVRNITNGDTAVSFSHRRDPERSWLKHIVSPALGVVITGFVLWNTDPNAKMAGVSWLAAGALFYLVLRRLGRSTDVADA
jgi:uncharacterized membrane protein HdeD (DUF308 family)